MLELGRGEQLVRAQAPGGARLCRRRKEPGGAGPDQSYTQADEGLEGVARVGANTVRTSHPSSKLLVRLLIADLVGEAATRESVWRCATTSASLGASRRGRGCRAEALPAPAQVPVARRGSSYAGLLELQPRGSFDEVERTLDPGVGELGLGVSAGCGSPGVSAAPSYGTTGRPASARPGGHQSHPSRAQTKLLQLAGGEGSTGTSWPSRSGSRGSRAPSASRSATQHIARHESRSCDLALATHSSRGCPRAQRQAEIASNGLRSVRRRSPLRASASRSAAVGSTEERLGQCVVGARNGTQSLTASSSGAATLPARSAVIWPKCRSNTRSAAGRP